MVSMKFLYRLSRLFFPNMEGQRGRQHRPHLQVKNPGVGQLGIPTQGDTVPERRTGVLLLDFSLCLLQRVHTLGEPRKPKVTFLSCH